MKSNDKSPRRGRPPGTTEQGAATRQRLYQLAIELFEQRGYEATTMRDIATEAGVSAGLLYRYFPSKHAVLLALYDQLSEEYAARAAAMQPGPWRTRFVFALRTSLDVLATQRNALAALTPILVSDTADGLFATATAFSRRRVQAAFLEAARAASDAPNEADAEVLGNLLYVAHLVVILWWLIDKSPRQRATSGLIDLIERLLPLASVTLRLKPPWAFVRAAEALCRDGLLGSDRDSTEARKDQ